MVRIKDNLILSIITQNPLKLKLGNDENIKYEFNFLHYYLEYLKIKIRK